MSAPPIERKRGRRRATFEKRKRLWAIYTTKGFAGFGKCKCGAIAYLAGPRVESKRCRDCVMDGKR